MAKIPYRIHVQNLKLLVRLPEETNLNEVDKLIRMYNEYLVSYNNGKPAELSPDSNTKLLILSLFSFLIDPEVKKRLRAPDTDKEVSNDDETIQKVRHLIELCNRELGSAP
mgnify:CR=1 FL=1